MKNTLLHSRYKYNKPTTCIPMSEKSIAARDEFTKKYKGKDILEHQKCYICRSDEFQVINERDRYGFYYPTGICNNCGNIQQVQYYKESILADFYENFYRKIYGHQTPEQLFLTQKKERGADIYKFASDIQAPKKVLEVGCGAGGILSVFRENKCDVLGLDFDANYLNFAKENDIQVRCGSIDQLNQGECFDLIILSHVLEHIIEPIKFLELLSEHLNENGILYIEVPSLHNVAAGGYKYDLLRYWQNAHTIHFSKYSLGLLCKQAGLKCIKSTDFIKSCWVKSTSHKVITNAELSNCSLLTKELLIEIERNRRGWKPYGALIRRFSVKALDFLGLKEVLQGLLKKNAP